MPDDPRQWAREELLKNLKSRRRVAHGAWYPPEGPAAPAPGSAAPAPRSATPPVPPAAPAPPRATAPPAATAPAHPAAAAAGAIPMRPLVTAPGWPSRATAGAPASGDLFAPATPAAPGPRAPAPILPTDGAPRPATRAARAAELELLARHSEACRRCALGSGRTQAVFGVGDPDARLMFVGEGPGRDEDAQGEPFVGRAGQKLNSLIEKLGLKRADVYITNVVKCRPPENRTPMPEEITACHPYLERQLEVVRPRVIVALGLPAAQTLLGLKDSMGQLRRQRYRLGQAVVITTYHPAYVLRNPRAAWDVWEDVKDVPQLLRELGAT